MGQFRRGCDLLTESIGIKATLATCDDIIDVKTLAKMIKSDRDVFKVRR